jgi:hypothetical protein
MAVILLIRNRLGDGIGMASAGAGISGLPTGVRVRK